MRAYSHFTVYDHLPNVTQEHIAIWSPAQILCSPTSPPAASTLSITSQRLEAHSLARTADSGFKLWGGMKVEGQPGLIVKNQSREDILEPDKMLCWEPPASAPSSPLCSSTSGSRPLWALQMWIQTPQLWGLLHVTANDYHQSSSGKWGADPGTCDRTGTTCPRRAWTSSPNPGEADPTGQATAPVCALISFPVKWKHSLTSFIHYSCCL